MEFKTTTEYLRRAYTTTLVVLFLLSLSFLFSSAVLAVEAGSVSGQVFEDLNFNNQIDFGEKKLNNWQVNLYQEQALVKSTFTNIEGRYHFNNLAPGQYQISVRTPDSTWVATNNKDNSFSISESELLNFNFPHYQIIREEKNIQPMVLLHNIKAENITPSSVKITWFSTHYSTSQVVYEKIKSNINLALITSNLSYQNSSPINFDDITYHSVVLSSLEPNSTYNYRVVSLADPKQWRGSSQILSSELSFTTLPALKQNPDNIVNQNGEVLGVKKENNNLVFNNIDEEIKPLIVSEINSNSNLEVSTNTTPIDEEEKLEEILETEKEQSASSTFSCQPVIWILIIINLVLIILLWSKGKRTKNKIAKKLWWISLILILVPLILAYPECWLNNWLIIVLVLNLVLLGGFKKKKNPPTDINSNSNASTESKATNFGDYNSTQQNQSSNPIDIVPPSSEGSQENIKNNPADFFE